MFTNHNAPAEGCNVDEGARLPIEDVSWSEPRSQRKIIQPICLELAPGRVLGIVRPNGAGKSTLLRLLYRYDVLTTGSVKVDNVDIWSVPARVAAQTVAAVLQEQITDFALTVREIVTLGRMPHLKGFGGGAGARDKAIVQGALDRLDLSNFSIRKLGALSGGERQRVMVARALAQEPRLLILDEPTNHLDIRHQLEVLTLIRELPLTIVTSLHDLNMAAAVCDDILMLQGGTPLSFGTPQTVLTESAVSEVFQVTAQQERLTPSDSKHFTFHL